MKNFCILIVLFALSGCQVIFQKRDDVYVRIPTEKHYDYHPPKALLKEKAIEHWEYAVMSENAYHRSELFPVGEMQRPLLDRCAKGTPAELSEYRKSIILGRDNPREDPEKPDMDLPEFENPLGTNLLEAAGWVEWKNEPVFLNSDVWCAAVKQGLAFRIYEKQRADGVDIVISFRGTVFSYATNWRANLRWFIQWPTGMPDANTVVQHQITKAVADEIIRKHGDKLQEKGALKIYATGHSLGGALAQQFTYAFPPKDLLEKHPNLRIAKVYVFDPSPATGWYWVDQDLREKNAGGVPVERVFQHGEILSYIRLLLGYFYKPTDGQCEPPVAGKECTIKISEVRYNLECGSVKYDHFGDRLLGFLSTPASNHSMRLLACGLATVADHPPMNVPSIRLNQ